MRMPNGELMSTSPIDRLAHRHGAERAVVLVDLRAREIDAVQLAFERAGARLRRSDRNKRSADRRTVKRTLPRLMPRSESTPCIRRAAVDALLQVASRSPSAFARLCRARAKCGPACRSTARVARSAMRVPLGWQFARLQPRFAVRRRDEDHCVVDRRGSTGFRPATSPAPVDAPV